MSPIQFDSTPQRLSTRTIPARIAREGSVLLLVMSRVITDPKNGAGNEVFIAIISCIGLFVSYLRWRQFSFYFTEKELVIDHGILVRSHRVIPYDRIQQVNHSANIITRVFGVASTVVETATQGRQGTVRFSYLSEENATALQQFLTDMRHYQARVANASASAMPDSEDAFAPIVEPMRAPTYEILRLSDGEIIKAALTGDHILRIAIVLVPAILVGWLLLALMMALSAWRYYLTHSTLVLTLEGDELHLSKGITQKTNVRMSISRVQKMVVKQNLLQRWIDRYEIEIFSAAAAAVGRRESRTTIAIPLVDRAMLDRLAVLFIPDFDIDGLIMPKRSVRRRTYLLRLPWTIPFVIIGAVTTWWLALAAGVIVAIVAFDSELAYRGLGNRVSEFSLVSRHHCVFRETVVVPIGKAQEMRLHSSLMQRRMGIGSLYVPTAGLGHHLVLTDADRFMLDSTLPEIVRAERSDETRLRSTR